MKDNRVRTTIPLSELRVGMTVEWYGKEYTVNKNDLKYDSFMGYSFRGSCYPKKITRIEFAVPTADGIKLR